MILKSGNLKIETGVSYKDTNTHDYLLDDNAQLE